MVKKMVMVLLIAAVVTGAAFAQMSAGAGGSYGYVTSSADGETNSMNSFGAFAFFDANYVMVKVGVNFSTLEESYLNMKYEYAQNYLALGVLGKFPIDLGVLTLFPMLGIEYDLLLGYDRTLTIGSSSSTESISRGDLSDTKGVDLGDRRIVDEADINLTDSMYLRPTLLYGINLSKTEAEADIDGLFKSKVDIGIAVGFKF
jgi:hypothetical protein